MTRALRSLRPLRDLAPVVETLVAWTRYGPIESRLYHDHAAKVTLARAAQRIGRVGNGLDAVGVPVACRCPAPLDKSTATP
jgi:hypothetical protein